MNPSRADAPARSVLLSQKPIGLGTPFVESLESYICRLARRHGVVRCTLQQLVNGYGPALYLDRQGPPRLDAPTGAAAAFADRLATLTGCDEVRTLGLGRFAGHLSTAHALRQHRAWCGKCFHDARTRGEEPHLQLLWTLAGFERCMIHGEVLETQCPCCGKRCKPSRSWHRDLDHCPWCGKDLADGRSEVAQSFAQLARRGNTDVDLFLGKVLGAFVAWASTPSSTVVAGDLRGLVEQALVRMRVRNMSDLAAAASVPQSTLVGLLKKTRRPSLQILARLAGAARVPLASMFTAEDMLADGPIPPYGLKHLARLKVSRRHIWAEVRRETGEVITSGESVSLQQLSKRLGVDQSYLGLKISSEARQILLERAKAARAQARQARLSELVTRIREAAGQLSANGLRVGARTVCEHLGTSSGSPYFRVAYKMARADT
ncbi:TniQ family protein [Roseateles sp.]|uniref:TniQ family protein n=1 Tax=Roseateles sp. TaxID=1971397 RepID=UPI0039EC8933